MKPAARLLLWLLVVAWLWVDLFVSRGPAARLLDASVAAVKQRDASLRFDQTLRAHLWRRGEDWNQLNEGERAQARERVQLALDEDARVHRAATAANAKAADRLVDTEEQNFTRMLQFEESRLSRLLAEQRVTMRQLRESMAQSIADQTWLDQQVAAAGVDADLVAAREHFIAPMLPERFHAAHVFLSGHEKDKPDRQTEIDTMAAMLLGKAATFEDLARQRSEDERTKLRGGDLGWFSRDRMPDDFMAAVMALQPGETSAPVRTKLGWHLIKLIATQAAAPVLFDSAGDEWRAEARNRRVAQSVEQLITSLPR